MFVWSADNMVYEYESLYPTQGTVYVYGINLISSRNNSAVEKYYLYNAHGDVVQLVSSSGTVTKTYKYDAFGVEYTPDANDTNYFRYCGQYFDTESGTYYLRARYYDPALGRFTQQDGWQYGDIYDPTSLNFYTYCINNPVIYYDPSGKQNYEVMIADTGSGSYGGYTCVPSYNTYQDDKAGQIRNYWVNVLLRCIREFSITPRILSVINYNANSKLSFSGFIYDQYSGDAAKVRMGFYTGDYNGCGWVATYNACVALGITTNPADIIMYYETFGGVLFYGTFGINPLSVKYYFCDQGYNANIYNLPSKIDSRISGSTVSILLYAHSSGAHYIMIQYFNGKYYAYNAESKTAPEKIDSIEAWLQDRGYTAISLITVS